MKKLYTFMTLVFAAFSANAQFEEEADVSLSNLTSNCYYTGYDETTQVISGINFLVLADGTNSDYVVPDFTVKLYLWDGANATFIHTYQVSGLHHFGTWQVSDASIDLDDVPGLASYASYRLGVYVDADNNITDEGDGGPDDTSNNAFLLQSESGNNDIPFTSGGDGGGGGTEKPDLTVSNVSFQYDAQAAMISNIQIVIDNIGDADAGSTTLRLKIEEVGNPGNYAEFDETIFDILMGESYTHSPGDLDLSFWPGFNSGATYQLTVTADAASEADESDESNNSYIINDISVVTGITGLKDLGLDIPNPVSPDVLEEVLAGNSRVKGYRLYDLTGKSRSLSGIDKGLYILKVDHETGSLSEKMLIRF